MEKRAVSESVHITCLLECEARAREAIARYMAESSLLTFRRLFSYSLNQPGELESWRREERALTADLRRV
jgi:hypothetical protein